MNQQTYGKLKALRLSGMADAYKEIAMDQRMNGLTAEELITLMVDREGTRRHHNTRGRVLRPYLRNRLFRGANARSIGHFEHGLVPFHLGQPKYRHYGSDRKWKELSCLRRRH